MPTTPASYRRLTRNHAGVGSYSSLWLADDHVTIVRSTGYHETYQRLQFGDVKGIFLTTTNRRIWWNIVWAVIAGWAGLVVIISLVSRSTPIASWLMLAVGVVGFAWNQLLGEGCRAFAVTAVQVAELSSVCRMPQARQILRELRPLIAAAQAGLATSPPSVSVPPAGPENSPPATPAPESPAPSAPPVA